MIDLQDDKLYMEVYQLMTRMSEICTDETLPKFRTRHLQVNKWKCVLKIPGVLKEAIGYGETETDSVNSCAVSMLGYLEREHKNNEYNPEAEDGYFKDNIYQWFGDVKYDENYYYYPFHCDIALDECDTFTRKALMKYADYSLNKLLDEGKVIETFSDIVSLRFLVKYKKKNLS